MNVSTMCQKMIYGEIFGNLKKFSTVIIFNKKCFDKKKKCLQ